MSKEHDNPYRSPLDSQPQSPVREPIETDDPHLRMLAEIRDILRENADTYQRIVADVARQKRAARIAIIIVSIGVGILVYIYRR